MHNIVRRHSLDSQFLNSPYIAVLHDNVLVNSLCSSFGQHQFGSLFLEIPYGLNVKVMAMLTDLNWLREKRLNQSGRQDLNLRPLRPERSALSKLSYSPIKQKYKPDWIFHCSQDACPPKGPYGGTCDLP